MTQFSGALRERGGSGECHDQNSKEMFLLAPLFFTAQRVAQSHTRDGTRRFKINCWGTTADLRHIPHYSIAVVWTLVFLVFPSLERRAQRQRAVPRVWVCCPAAGSHVAGCFGGADGPPDPGLTAVAGEASRARKRGVRAQRKDLRSGVRLRSSPIYFAAQHGRGPRW